MTKDDDLLLGPLRMAVKHLKIQSDAIILAGENVVTIMMEEIADEENPTRKNFLIKECSYLGRMVEDLSTVTKCIVGELRSWINGTDRIVAREGFQTNYLDEFFVVVCTLVGIVWQYQVDFGKFHMQSLLDLHGDLTSINKVFPSF